MNSLDVDVFLADIRDHDCAVLARQLCRESTQRLKQIAHPRRRMQFMLGRVLLNEALRQKHGLLAQAWRLDAGSAKPRLFGAGAPEISLSHSKEWVACAMAPVEIGLDVEFCRERDFTALAEQICNPDELSRFLAHPVAEQGFHFYRMWTLKEATYKLYGGALPALEKRMEIQSAHFVPRQGFLAALVARSASPINLILHFLPRR